MRRSRFASGFSLLEVVVYSSLLLFLMGGVYLMVTGGLYYFQSGRAFQDVQNQAGLALRQMGLEIANGTVLAVNLDEVNPADHIILLSADRPMPNASDPWTYNAVNELERHKWVCFFRNGDNELIRTESSAAGAPVALPPVPAMPTLSTFQTIASPPTRVIARQISFLQFQRTLDLVSVEIHTAESPGSAATDVTQVVLTLETRMRNPR